MHVKKAFLHCSYAAPVRVSDMDAVFVSAARATIGVVVVRAVTFCAVVARSVDAARDVETAFVGRPATVCDAPFDDVAERDVFVVVRCGNTDVLAADGFSVVVVR